jgi:hypothetical protein
MSSNSTGGADRGIGIDGRAGQDGRCSGMVPETAASGEIKGPAPYGRADRKSSPRSPCTVERFVHPAVESRSLGEPRQFPCVIHARWSWPGRIPVDYGLIARRVRGGSSSIVPCFVEVAKICHLRSASRNSQFSLVGCKNPQVPSSTSSFLLKNGPTVCRKTHHTAGRVPHDQ